jgi:hypothetical protein
MDFRVGEQSVKVCGSDGGRGGNVPMPPEGVLRKPDAVTKFLQSPSAPSRALWI